jgi:hypothetical protein
MSAREFTPGEWVMVDQWDHPYGVVKLVRRGGELGYRADRRPNDTDDTAVLVGYFTNLRAACKAVHMAYVRVHSGAPVNPNAPNAWGTISDEHLVELFGEAPDRPKPAQ